MVNADPRKTQETGDSRARATLETSGLRVTPQRIAVLRILAAADDHPDAPELHRRAKTFDAAISLPTVYRNLAVLEHAGLVERHCFEGGGARFETTIAGGHDAADATLALLPATLRSLRTTGFSVPTSVSVSSPRMNASTRLNAMSSWICCGGLFMK